MIPHEDNPSGSQWIMVYPKFIELQTVKQNETAEELLPIKRTPQISKRTKNKANVTSLLSLDPKFKNVVIKILKELKKLIDRNTVHYDKELETIKINQSKTVVQDKSL